MNALVVPLLSARCTITILVFGSVTPGLSLTMAGSCHDVILPRKIFARFSPGNLHRLLQLGQVVGDHYRPRRSPESGSPASYPANAASFNGASEAPKSTVPDFTC